MIGLPIFITGPLVNMFLFLATSVVGVTSGVLVGGLTPWIALVRGILPAPLAPMTPYIIAGNISLVVVYYLAKRTNNYLAIAGAAGFKYLVLAYAVKSFVQVPDKIAKVMQIPQLLTSLAGGLLAIYLIKLIKKADIDI
ncbi:hypothetical protein JCM15060_23300 [Halanaerobaculum tunisiense]